MLQKKYGLLPLLPLALLAFGCSGGGGKKELRPAQPDGGTKAAGSGKVTLNLVNDSAAEGLKAVTLKLAGMDIRQKGKDWVALPLTAPEIELLNATGPVKPLVEAAQAILADSFPPHQRGMAFSRPATTTSGCARAMPCGT